MKALKLLAIALILLVALFLVAGLFAPKNQSVSQSTIIKAPAFAVFQHIKYMDKMAKWHPSLKKDPNVQISTQGQDGEVGAIRFWKSENDMVGEGFDEILEMKQDLMLKSKISTVRPKSSTSTSTFLLDQVQDGMKVTWTFDYTVPYPFNAFLLFQDDSDAQKKFFAEGLVGLKNILERFERAAVNYQLSEYDFAGGMYLFQKAKTPYKDVDIFVKKAVAELSNFRKTAGLMKSGNPIVCLDSWGDDNIVEVRVGVPITDRKDFPDGLVMNLPPREGCKSVYVNDLFGDKEKAHRQIKKQLRDQNIDFDFPIIEEWKKYQEDGQGTQRPSIRLVYQVN